MQTNPVALCTILGMAFVTYLTRAGGLWLMGHVTVSARLKAWLGYLPGTLLVALVAPTVLSTGIAETGASIVTILVAMRTRNLLLAMLIGMGAVVILRLLQTYLL
jgi:uncharacterized membrane protein